MDTIYQPASGPWEWTLLKLWSVFTLHVSSHIREKLTYKKVGKEIRLMYLRNGKGSQKELDLHVRPLLRTCLERLGVSEVPLLLHNSLHLPIPPIVAQKAGMQKNWRILFEDPSPMSGILFMFPPYRCRCIQILRKAVGCVWLSESRRYLSRQSDCSSACGIDEDSGDRDWRQSCAWASTFPISMISASGLRLQAEMPVVLEEAVATFWAAE